MSVPDSAIPVLCFAAVALATYALLAVFDPYWQRVRVRVGALEQSNGASAHSVGGVLRKWMVVPSDLSEALDRARPNQAARRSQLQQRLAKAGIYHASAVSRYRAARLLLVLITTGATALSCTAGHVRSETTVLAACIAGGIAALLPSLWLDRAVVRHHILLRRSLPDFLDLMTVCLDGGMSLQETIRRVSDELRLAHPALAAELSIVQRDIELGATVDQALKRFASRTDYEGVKTLGTFVREAQRFGTNITEALRSHADMLRSQREQAAEESAQKAAVKILLPTLFLIFPAIFVVAVAPALIQIKDAFAAK